MKTSPKRRMKRWMFATAAILSLTLCLTRTDVFVFLYDSVLLEFQVRLLPLLLTFSDLYLSIGRPDINFEAGRGDCLKISVGSWGGGGGVTPEDFASMRFGEFNCRCCIKILIQ